MKKSVILLVLVLIAIGCIYAQNQPTFYMRGLLDMWKKGAATTASRITKYNAVFPPGIQGNVVYSLGVNSAWYYTKYVSDYTSFIDDNYLDLCKRVDSTGISYVVNVAEVGNYPNAMPATTATFISGVGSYYLTPAQVDNIFANTTNCVGIESGENFWTYNATTVNMVLDMLRVCKKYNKKYILGEGGWGFNSFTRFLNENYTTLKNERLGDYLLPVFKNTKPMGALVSQSAVMGAWVSGLTAGFGTWNDEWIWTYASFKYANQFPAYLKSENNYTLVPYTHYLKSWLLTIAMGGNTAFMETPSFSRAGVADANSYPYFTPFVKGLADHNIMPSKSAVLSKVKAIADPYSGTYNLSNGTTAAYTSANLLTYRSTVVAYKPVSTGTYIDPYGRLYNNTYGIWNDTAYTNMGSVTDKYYSYPKTSTGQPALPNALMRELIPNNARFYIIPALPHANAAASVPAGVEIVPLSSYQTDAELKDKFNALYPATANEGGAWAVEIDNSFFVINSHENADIDQNFTFNLGTDVIEKIDGVMPFQNILFGKREGTDNYWFQSNGYSVKNGTTSGQKYTCTVKPTVVTFKCKAEPVLQVEDNKSAYVAKIWNATTNTLQLTINHTPGAVNFRITAPASGIHDVNSMKLSLYPNPAKDLVSLQITGDAVVSFYNIAGVLVKSSTVTATKQSINIEDFLAGAYIAKAHTGGVLMSCVLIKK